MAEPTLTPDLVELAPDDTATAELLRRTAELAIRWRTGLAERPVGTGPSVTPDALRAALGGPLPRDGSDAWTVVSDLARDADPGLIAMSGPRYFGFVIGGSVPSALAADWLDVGLGPERGALPRHTVSGRGRGDCRRLVGRASGAALGHVRRLRRPGATMAQHDLPRRRAQRGAAHGQAGTSRKTGSSERRRSGSSWGDDVHTRRWLMALRTWDRTGTRRARPHR